MKFCSLYSGSSGNSLFVSNKNTKLLVDAGLSGIRIQRALTDIGEKSDEVCGILVTHEHRDHIHGLGVMSRRFDLPIYANEKTWEAMVDDLGKIAPHNIKTFEFDKPFSVEDLEIEAFRTSHDAADSAGFIINDGKKRLGIATDSGIITPEMTKALFGCDLTLLESNHDVSMLEAGSYPFYLKQRIKSDYGHLSNEIAGNLALSLVKKGTKHLILAHLSEENNYPLLAYETTARILAGAGVILKEDVDLFVAKRSSVSEIIEL
ncbi:MBL fold metallo-hydrolase [Acetobacterium paludosum]|uniref:MBL fold metallo-hydrolase n=1 Tax=Acetobacterium paludosum TaxID=52693 RepID=A0A923HWS9_9FIRM|nr:MBL fold metallo-hydrolase [Acetobacterium paludosum]MBC3889949.1 MBL fold metallo-hydrolase [Acetobacterium paludosum]